MCHIMDGTGQFVNLPGIDKDFLKSKSRVFKTMFSRPWSSLKKIHIVYVESLDHSIIKTFFWSLINECRTPSQLDLLSMDTLDLVELYRIW